MILRISSGAILSLKGPIVVPSLPLVIRWNISSSVLLVFVKSGPIVPVASIPWQA